LERVEETAQLFWEVEPLEEAGDGAVARRSETRQSTFKAVFRIRIRRIHMFLGLPDPNPLVRDTDPDPSIIKQKKYEKH
jgi:hypothetical protein